MVVDANGNVHVLVRGETGKLAYFTRDATIGEWDRRDPELDLNGSGNLIVGADNDLYAVVNDIWFLHASRASGWSDWSVIEQAHDNQTPNGTAAVDGRRFAADSWFSVIGQKGRDVVVMDYRP